MELYSIVISKHTRLNPKRLLKIYIIALIIIFISMFVVIFVVGAIFNPYGKDNLRSEAIYLTVISFIFLVFNFFFGFIFLRRLSKLSFAQGDSHLFKKLAFFLFVCLLTFFIHAVYLVIIDYISKVKKKQLIYFIFNFLIFFFLFFF